VVFLLNESKDPAGIAINKTDSAAATVMPVVRTEQPVADTGKTVETNQPADGSVSTILKNNKPEKTDSIPSGTLVQLSSINTSPVTDSVKPVSLDAPNDEAVTTIVKSKKPVNRNDSGEFPGNKRTIPADSVVKQVAIEELARPLKVADSLPVVSVQAPLPVGIDTANVQENKTAGKVLPDNTDQWAVKPVTPVDTAIIKEVEKPVVTDTLTVAVDIPAVKELTINQSSPEKADSINAVIRDSVVQAKPTGIIKEKETVMDSVSTEVRTDTVKTIPTSEPVITVQPIVKENPQPAFVAMKPLRNCTAYADDDEYLNLRKKMDRIRDNEGQMLSLAHKLFEKRCFNTRQLQRLSLLFQSNEGKYKLFDDAYNHTSDPENYPSLITELTDEYYRRRFLAMLR